MKIVIAGDGKVGYALARQLSAEGHDIVVIDSDEEALLQTTNTLDVMGIHGNGASYSVQMGAGVKSADLVIAATSTDELNILCCILAKKIGAKNTIARVRNPEYADQLDFMKDELGLSMSVNPEMAAAMEIFRTLKFPGAIKIDTFVHGRVELVEFRIEAGSPLVGQPLYDLYNNFQVRVLICAVQRNGSVYIPKGDFVLEEGDRIHITAEPMQIMAFFRTIGAMRGQVRDVIIIGGGRISYYLAKKLSAIGAGVKIIELDQERCLYLSDELPHCTIIHGDGSDQDLLEEEGIAETDALVALTGIDEENVILGMYAKSLGVPKAIVKVDRISFMGLLKNIDIDMPVSPKELTANMIVRYVRAMRNTAGARMETLYKLVNQKVEALEFIVEEGAYIGIPLAQLNIRENVLIASIARGNRIIIPGGRDTVEAGDRVVVVTTIPRVRDLAEIFAV
ncbi:MAG: Trk system potassium transporter TrkA [Christensenellales bacterium]